MRRSEFVAAMRHSLCGVAWLVIVVAMVMFMPYVLVSEPLTRPPTVNGMFDALESVPPGKTVGDLAFTMNTTVAVVGSSGTLKGRSYGFEIDAHDIVIRTNGAPLDGYEVDVGNTTDIRVTYWGGYKDAEVRRVPAPRLATIVVTVMNGAHSSHDFFEAMPVTTLVVSNKWSRALRRVQLGGRGWPSTGFQALSIAIALTQHVQARPPTVYGFGPCACVHYYDCRGDNSSFSSSVTEEGAALDGGVHAFGTEFVVRRQWDKSGVIDQKADVCDDPASRPPLSTPTRSLLYDAFIAMIAVLLAICTALAVARWATPRRIASAPLLWRAALGARQRDFLVCVFFKAILPLQIAQSKDDHRSYAYLPLTVLFLSEVGKLLLSLALCMRQPAADARRVPSFHAQLVYLFPASMFVAKNCILFYVLASFDPVNFQVLLSLQFAFSTVLMSIVAKRRIRSTQLIALILFGCASATLNVTTETADQGLLVASMIVLSSFLSGTASVYLELTPRITQQTIHLENALIYGWGVLLTACVLVRNHPGAFLAGGFFDGYTWNTVAIVVTHTLTGLSTALALRYSTKLSAHAVAMLVTFALQALLVMRADIHTTIAVFVVACSAWVYQLPLTDDANEPPTPVPMHPAT